MPRKTRQFLPGMPCHLIQRGNNRSACFRETRDRRDYLDWLHRYSTHFEVAVHAYVLMSNHVHLLVTPVSADGIPGMMQSLGRCYVRRFNDRHERTGTLWEGRYRSETVTGDGHVLACYRYIELNPVRAGMVEQPVDYPWSSHRGNTGVRHDPLLKPHDCWRGLGNDLASRHEAYRWFVTM
jgi:putative transposase